MNNVGNLLVGGASGSRAGACGGARARVRACMDVVKVVVVVAAACLHFAGCVGRMRVFASALTRYCFV